MTTESYLSAEDKGRVEIRPCGGAPHRCPRVHDLIRLALPGIDLNGA